MRLWFLAASLSLGSAVALGFTRFAYALLLPSMRDDLEWSYTLAGAVNTSNACGYLLGAMATPLILRRFEPTFVIVVAIALATAFMAATGFAMTATMVMFLRFAVGVTSAFAFIAGGILAARLANERPRDSGLVLGIYYAGTGWGILVSAMLVPYVLKLTVDMPHGWTWAWWALATCCACSLLLLQCSMQALGPCQPAKMDAAPIADVIQRPIWREFSWALCAYFMFGVGNIGYMTFVIALLRQQEVTASVISIFYGLLGMASIAAPSVWSKLLSRFKGGQPLAILNLILGAATIIPALTSSTELVLLSAALFGGAFLSVVAATTALVRHNLPPSKWPAGISVFTVFFAVGQILGPTLVGWIADGRGGLSLGFIFSALALWFAALAGWMQRPIASRTRGLSAS
jgi:predicted MFS family arabinose efflux permease